MDQGLLAACRRAPWDMHPRNIFADHCEDNGDATLAARLRDPHDFSIFLWTLGRIGAWDVVTVAGHPMRYNATSHNSLGVRPGWFVPDNSSLGWHCYDEYIRFMLPSKAKVIRWRRERRRACLYGAHNIAVTSRERHITYSWLVASTIVEEIFHRTPMGWWFGFSYLPAYIGSKPKDLPPTKTGDMRWFVRGGLLRPPYLPTEGTLEWNF